MGLGSGDRFGEGGFGGGAIVERGFGDGGNGGLGEGGGGGKKVQVKGVGAVMATVN